MSQAAHTITLPALSEMKKRGEKIAVLTAYDASFARVLDGNGVDIILVGDSLGMVIQGHGSTLPVTLDHMTYHCANVARVTRRAMVMADMPFMSFSSPERALDGAGRLMQEGGAHIVKIEGGGAFLPVVETLASHGIPVCAHLGLLPQSVHKLGGYRVQGKDELTARVMQEDALAMQDAGADLLLLECVPATLGTAISQALRIPVIGIGAGPGCDAQVLVLHDILGLTPGKPPKFSYNFLDGKGGVAQAIAAYVHAVKSGDYPGRDHSY